MAGEQHGVHLSLGVVDARHVLHRHGDVAQEALAGEAQAAGGVGHEDDVVLVLSPRRCALGRHHAHNLKGDVVDQHELADAVAVRKQGVRDRAAEHGHGGVARFVLGAKEGARGHFPVARDDVVGRGAVDAGAVVDVACAHGDRAALFGHRGEHVGQLGNGVHVFDHQRRWRVAAAGVGCARAYGEQVGAHGADLFHHFLLGAIADGEHGDHRGHADDDAEQGQRGAKQVCAQRTQRGAGGFDDIGQERDVIDVGGEVRLGAGGQARARVGDDATVADLDDALRLLGDLALVGDEDDGVAGRRQLMEQLHDLGTGPGVERARGFVGKHDATTVHQRARDRHALLLAAGELAGAMVKAFGQPQRGQELLGALMAARGRHARVHRRHLDVVARAGAADEVVALKHEAEGLAPHPCQLIAAEAGDIFAHEAIGAAAGSVKTAEDVHQRALARARGAHDGDEFTGVDLEVYALRKLRLMSLSSIRGTAAPAG